MKIFAIIAAYIVSFYGGYKIINQIVKEQKKGNFEETLRDWYGLQKSKGDSE